MNMISDIFNVNSIYDDDEDALLFWQKKIFTGVFLILILIGIIPYVLSCGYAFKNSEWLNIFIYTCFYLWVCGAVFLKRVPFQIRVWSGISGFYAMGVFSMLSTGLMGSTRLYFMCFAAFAAIFSGIRGGLFSLLLNMATLAVFGILYSERIIMPQDARFIPGPMQWVVFTGTFSFLCAAVTLSLAVLIKALEISGKEFKHLVKNTPDVIWALDTGHIITFINSAVFPMLGYTRKELTGKSLDQLFSKERVKEFQDHILNHDEFNYETVIGRKDDIPVHVEISGSKINDFSDSHNMYQGMIKDISKKKAEEEKKKELKEKLLQAEKLKAVGILAGSVAHDLNIILSGPATYPEVLMMDTDLDPKIRQGLALIKDSGQKAAAVVSDLLTISRGAGVEMEIININSILERYIRAHDFQKIRDANKGVDIDITTEPELLNIKGSYIHIEKIIMNLVLNSVEEVSQKNDAKVMISTTNSFIDPTTPGYEDIIQGEYAVLSVADNGSGIDKEDIKKIFEPFFTKKQMGRSGTGLGLTIVWNAVQDHRGFINVASDSKGTRFDLLFPAVRKEIPQRPDHGSLDDIKGEGQIILVVDDLKEQQKIAVSILENLGYCPKAVDNGYEAVEVIKKETVDLIILDMIMTPSISGLETYRMIKEIRPGQKAIIASGYSESDDVLLVQDMGAGSFIKKPYTILDMGIAVKEELEK
ncbi:MAG: ATP-binding protein [Desulfobacula sp.]|jgi:PAS domain S-box-containing protein